MKRAKILGTGMYVPSNIVTNEDLSRIVDTNDKWVTTRTGIKERRISLLEDTSELGTKAAINALEEAGVSPEELDLIIFATITSETLTPSCACLVQKNIGAVNATAFDINAACSGFIYGLSIADNFIKNGSADKVLVIGAEVLSKIIDWQDRNTCVLFGDGAGAVILTGSDDSGILSVYTKSVGEKGDSLKCHSVNFDNPFIKNKCEIPDSYVRMEGREVFRFATMAITEAVEKVVEDAGIQLEDISYVIPHQANYRIIDFASKKLNLSMDKFYINLDKYGNTSSASVPIALHEALSENKIKKGDNIVLVGFGGGLTYGSALIKW